MQGCIRATAPKRQQIMNLQTDNGSEFANYFEQASIMLGIQRYFSRVRTPKDNPEVERFNKTLKYEWLYDCNLTTDCDEFNPAVTDWLIEYNFNRPHQALRRLRNIGNTRGMLSYRRSYQMRKRASFYFFKRESIPKINRYEH